MSGSASLDLERLMLGHTLAIAPMPTLARVYVALCQTAPTEAAGGSELAGGGYVRTAATFALLATPANAASNATVVDFAPATADWRPISYFELWTQATGGTRLYWGQLLDPTDGAPIEIDVLSGSAVRFSPGSLVVMAAEVAGAVGIGPFLPTAGGEMTGPLAFAPTGSPTTRALQDWAGDIANVLNFGADPTGVADSSPAINAAAATLAADGSRHKAVYLPTGKYRINSQINLTAAQALYGDTRGSSVLQVDDRFDPAATAVISITSAYYDTGPVIHDLGITFAQPSDQASRANFKTLAEGGASGTGGTGVKYPWAIRVATGSSPTRVQVIRVRVGGAWDGITSNNQNHVFWIEDVEMGALNCGLSLGEGPSGIQDFVHVTDYHFWDFDMSSTLYTGVYSDGNTIAMRVGRVDGLIVSGFLSHRGRLVVTPDAAGFCSISIANCSMDTADATIEINGAMLFFHIDNLSGSAAADRAKPFLQVNASCRLMITNHYSHSSSGFSDFVVDDPNAIVSVSNFYSLFNVTSIPWAEVKRGHLRLTNGNVFFAGPRTVAAIAETATGILIVDDITVTSGSGATSSGPLISIVNNNNLSMIGNLRFMAGNSWTFSVPAAITQRFYSPVTDFNGGALASVRTIGPTTGTMNVMSARINRVAAGGLTATGTTRADALQLTADINRISTVAPGTGVILPATGVAGDQVTIYQSGANTLKVYGAGSSGIDAVSGTTGVSLSAGKAATFTMVGVTWLSNQLGIAAA